MYPALIALHCLFLGFYIDEDQKVPGCSICPKNSNSLAPDFIAVCTKVWNHENLSIFASSEAETCAASFAMTSHSISKFFVVLESPNLYLLHNVG